MTLAATAVTPGPGWVRRIRSAPRLMSWGRSPLGRPGPVAKSPNGGDRGSIKSHFASKNQTVGTSQRARLDSPFFHCFSLPQTIVSHPDQTMPALTTVATQVLLLNSVAFAAPKLASRRSGWSGDDDGNVRIIVSDKRVNFGNTRVNDIAPVIADICSIASCGSGGGEGSLETEIINENYWKIGHDLNVHADGTFGQGLGRESPGDVRPRRVSPGRHGEDDGERVDGCSVLLPGGRQRPLPAYVQFLTPCSLRVLTPNTRPGRAKRR